MAYPTIISFYTNDWEYPQHAARLKQECIELGLEYIIQELPSTGYLQNCQKKPCFIRETIQKLKCPVLWVDVDASIYKLPEYFVGLDADASFKSLILQRDRSWHVGTMWFNYTENTIDMLNLWCIRVESYNSHVKLTGDHSDESAINELYSSGLINAKIVDMPKEYFYVDEITGFKDDAVIFHRISHSESKAIQAKQIGVYL